MRLTVTVHRGLFALIVCSLVLMSPALARAATYNFSWEGIGGYELQGSFSFEASAASDGVVLQEEMSELVVTAFDSIGNALATYDFGGSFSFPLTLQNFNFDIATQDIPLGGGFDAVYIGSYAGGVSNWLFSSDIGCGSLGSAGRGIGLFNDPTGTIGSCSTLEVLDQNLGSSLTFAAVSDTSPIPLPASALLVLTGLFALSILRTRFSLS